MIEFSHKNSTYLIPESSVLMIENLTNVTLIDGTKFKGVKGLYYNVDSNMDRLIDRVETISACLSAGAVN